MFRTEIIRKYLDQIYPTFEKELKEFISGKASVKKYAAGDVLQTSRSIWLVVRGNVKVYREAPDGSEFYIYMIGLGETCPVTMLYQMNPQQAQETKVKAMEEAEIILLPAHLMNEMMQKFSSWNSFVLETCRCRFETLLELADNVVFRNMDERLELYLRDLVQRLGTRNLNITHQEIANDLNSSREVITRLLKKMEQRGMLKSDRQNLEWLG
jgi:CRP/FNR family transcriptional regulator